MGISVIRKTINPVITSVIKKIGDQNETLKSWILSTGYWADAGIWDDSETWNDGV